MHFGRKVGTSHIPDDPCPPFDMASPVSESDLVRIFQTVHLVDVQPFAIQLKLVEESDGLAAVTGLPDSGCKLGQGHGPPWLYQRGISFFASNACPDSNRSAFHSGRVSPWFH